MAENHGACLFYFFHIYFHCFSVEHKDLKTFIEECLRFCVINVVREWETL